MSTPTNEHFEDNWLPSQYTLHVLAGQRYEVTLQDLDWSESTWFPPALFMWEAPLGIAPNWLQTWSPVPSSSTAILAAGGDGDIQLGAAGAPGHAYRIQVTPTFSDDHGDVPRTASPASVGEPVSGYLDLGGDVDAFTFDLVEGQRVRFSVNDPLLRLQLTSDVSGFCDSGEGALVYVAPWSGHHVLSIASAGNLGTDYTLYSHLCVDDHGDTTATATPLQAESTVTGTVDGWGDSDLFSMDLEAGQRYELSMTGDYDYTMRAWVGTEDGRLVSSDPNLSADQNSLWLSGDQLGRVYLGVQADRTEPSAYQVKLTAIGRDDHGDGLRDATAMRLGEEVSGRWDASADVDAFVVQAVAGQRYQFQLQTADATLPFGVHLQPLEFDTLHGAFGPHTSSDGDTTLTYTWQADHDGPFALMTRSPATGRYLLSVVTVPLDDHADVPMGASPLALGATGKGRLDSPSDLDCFSLDVEAGEYYTYSVEYTGPLQLAILDNMGQSVAGMSASAREAGTVASFTVEAPSTGRITLAVHSDQPTSDDFWLSFRRADSHDIWAPIDHGRLTVDPLPVDLSGVWLPTWDNTLQP